MGSSQSTTTTTNDQSSSSSVVEQDLSNKSNLYKKYPPRQFPREDFKPSAAVIGAGLAGCHCAWELSRLGFNVTVYEQSREAGEGATKYDSGLVCADESGFVPSVWSMTAKKDLLFSLLMPFIPSGPFISGETPFNGFFRESWRTWAWSRRKLPKSSDYIKLVAGELAGGTNELVEEMIQSEPERFGSCVIGRGENVLTSLTPAQQHQQETQETQTQTKISKWLTLDTSQWCKNFASLLEKDYGVKFKYRSMITRFQWRVNENNEFCTSVIATDIPTRFTSADPFDIVVVAAGSMSIVQRNPKMNEGYGLPLLAVAGYGMDVPISYVKDLVGGSNSNNNENVDNNSDNNSISSKMKEEKSLWQKLMPYHLSAKDFLRITPTPPSASRPILSESEEGGETEQQQKQKQIFKDQQQGEEEPRVRISGLLSLNGDDVRGVHTEPSNTYATIYRRLTNANVLPAELSKLSYNEMDDPETGLSGFRYARGITSDGLPIVSRCGNARNVFVCCGFGDDAAMLAPASAHWLGEVITKKRATSVKYHHDTKQEEAEEKLQQQIVQGNDNNNKKNEENKMKWNPLALDRFYEFEHVMQYDDVRHWQQRWYWMEKTLEEVGQPILDRLWADFFNTSVGKKVSRLGHKKEDDS